MIAYFRTLRVGGPISKSPHATRICLRSAVAACKTRITMADTWGNIMIKLSQSSLWIGRTLITCNRSSRSLFGLMNNRSLCNVICIVNERPAIFPQPSSRCTQFHCSLKIMPRFLSCAGSMKRGVSEKERQLHEYLVSRSVRNTKALEGLQKVGTITQYLRLQRARRLWAW